MSPAIPQTAIRDLRLQAPWRERLFPNNEWVLLLVILIEGAIFSVTGNNFLSGANAFEITRLSVEVGLLALALTPIIITAGIDLSVGSMMGLAAVMLGSLWRDAHLPIVAAAAIALLVGVAGGGLNALMIARLRFPPLIVTLGTFSLFRGIAEGVTRGIENYSGFSPQFLFLGQGYVGGLVPTQLFVLVAAIALSAWWLQRTTYGRSLYAIGFSPEGARYAGINVARRLAFVFVLSGLVSSIAAIIYVAHLGQAKSDAGTGYELMAITAVVLGGTSIFGGRGTVLGTVLGLFAIVILQNGLRLSAQPAELAGILTGALLLGPILLERLSLFDKLQLVGAAVTRRVQNLKGSQVESRQAEAYRTSGGEVEVRNSQLTILSVVILVAAVIVAATNWLSLRALRADLINPAGSQRAATAPAHKPVIALMPMAKGDPYFVSCKQGADEAAKELGVELLWDGQTDLDPAKQNEVVEAWITRGVVVFAETQTVLKVYPGVKLIMAIAAPAVPGAAEAVQQSGRTDVKVTGLSLPNMNKPYVKAGVVESVVLWNTIDLGYLTVYAAHALSTGKLKRGDNEINAGRLGKIEVANDEVRLGAPFIFDKHNIDQFNF